MDMNPIGKFEVRRIINEFDSTLIRLYGVNMRDAEISRYEALNACREIACPSKAAEIFGLQRGFNVQPA